MSKKESQEEHMLTTKEKRLMAVLFDGGTTEQDILLFTRELDVDTASSDYMLMLSYLGLSINWRWFPKEIVPRLQGLHRYYQVRNAMGIKGVLERIDLLSKAGIPVMLIKGMAIRYYYAAGVPRIMSDMDLLVPEDKYEQAIKLLCASGGTEGGRSMWSVHIINGLASIDLHKWMFKHHGDKNENIWERAVPIDFYGRTVYVPSPEDMFVHQLDTRARAIFVYEAEARRLRWLYDCRNICMKDTFDWKLAMQRIKQFHSENTAYFMLKAFADCFPEVITDSFVEESVTPTEDYEKWLKQHMRYRELMRKFDKVQEEKSFWKHVLIWPVTRYYDYNQKRFEMKIVDGVDLSFVQYMKKANDQKSILGCIKYLAKNALRRAKQYKKGDSDG